jgi:dTDP-4-dehydrorhamnose reductase
LHVLVIRTAAVYGGARGFPHRIVERASRGEALRVVSDQSVNPTYARDLAAVAKRLAERQVDGIVHATNTGCCTWYEFACAVLEEAGIDAPVEPVSTGDYPAAARRPKNGCLASSRIPPLRPWREALHEALNP